MNNTPGFILNFGYFLQFGISLIFLLAPFALGGGHGGGYGGGYGGGHGAAVSSFPTSHGGGVGFHGPLANPHVQKDGHIGDTKEVAAVRGLHFSALAHAGHYGGGGHGGGDGGGDGGHGYWYDGGYEGASHGIFSHGGGTHDGYKGEHGWAGLYAGAASTGHGYGGGYGGGHH